MGEVYRARDTKLNRDVAIKVLLPAVANDPDRLARFSREAQVLASLNHPNIAHIHGLEESNGVTALVLELVEGEDLAQRIARGPIPLDEALPIARQIAEALEAAHDHGIIHRDLKPANIKVRPDGTVKVLDFGLAKAIDPTAGSSATAMNSPTLSIYGTQAGIILGTAAYMAPEQAKGKAVDKRADVWAFGVVLYEMLTGAKAFPGEDISDTLATLLKFEPDWNLLPGDTPPSIRRLLRRCLIKDPKSRLRECGSAIADIDEASSGSDPSMAVAPAVGDRSRVAGRGWVMPAIAAMSLVALAGVTAWAVWGNRTPDAPQPTRRFTITLPESHELAQGVGTLLALSPDGRTLVYRANPQNASPQLFRRPIDQFGGLLLPGTENAREPLFFSPDGQWLGFQVEQTLKKIALAGGPPQTLATRTTTSRGGSWGSDGDIVIGDNGAGGSLFKIPDGSGAATALFTGEGSNQAWYPQILSGGKLVLFTDFANVRDGGALHLLDLESGSHRMVLPNASAGRVLPSGHLIFVRGATLWAVPFDLANLKAVGTPVPVVDGVRVESGGAVQYTVSDEGTLAYIPGTQRSAERTLAFVNRDGRSETLTAPPRDYQELALSPDQTRVAVQIGSGADADVWVVEVARGTLTRVTGEPGFDGYPLWSKDGASVVFASTRNPPQFIIQRKSADGTGEATPLATFDKASTVRPNSWSADGGTLVVQVGTSAQVNHTIATVAVDGKSQPKPLIQSGAYPVVSPDGRWLAYFDEGQVYLQRFPGLGDRRVVSAAGGGWMPAWSRDGGELFYLRGGPPNAVMRVKVQTSPDGRADIGTESVLAGFRYYSPRASNRFYEVTRDAQRLLVISSNAAETESRNQINIVTNWFEELKRLVPLK